MERGRLSFSTWLNQEKPDFTPTEREQELISLFDDWCYNEHMQHMAGAIQQWVVEVFAPTIQEWMEKYVIPEFLTKKEFNKFKKKLETLLPNKPKQ